MPILKTAEKGALEALVEAVLAGRVAVFPTDTVYGLGCALNREAADRIYRIKNRPSDKPFPLLIADFGDADAVADFSPEARKWAVRLWPGANTLVLAAGEKTPAWACRDGKVALRIPAYQFLREAIRRTGGPIVGTSANLSGERPARSVAEIPGAILTAVDLIIDGGEVPGRPSRVYDLTGPAPVLLRG